jgi:hypothetical protein
MKDHNGIVGHGCGTIDEETHFSSLPQDFSSNDSVHGGFLLSRCIPLIRPRRRKV